MSCVTIVCIYSSEMVLPDDVQDPGMLADLPAVAQRGEEDVPLYQLPRTRIMSKASAHTAMSSRYATDAWYGISFLFFYIMKRFHLLLVKESARLSWNTGKIHKDIMNKFYYVM